MPLNDIVDVTITTDSARVKQAGFGIPLILSATAAFAERVREFAEAADIVAAGLPATSPEYLAAQAMFSQNPRPPKVLIGRATRLPTQRFIVTVKSVLNTTAYKLKVNGTEVTFTSDATATTDEIRTGLQGAINALGLALTVNNEIGTSDITITANVAGAWFRIEVTTPTLLGIVQNHADPGAAADLTELKAVNNDWYGLMCLFPSAAYVAAIAGWAEANDKIFIQQTQDSPVPDTAAGGTDVGSTLATAAYMRTALIYHPDNGAFVDAAWMGKCLPLDPGSETWKFKTLSGVAATQLTGAQVTNLKAKNANYYYAVGGVNITADGKVSGNEWIDTIRGRDWLEARMAERIFGTLANAAKVPFTDKGIGVIEADVRAQLREGVAVGLLSDNPMPTVTVPKAADSSATDKANRILRGLTFSATLAGAIHEVRITGRVSV